MVVYVRRVAGFPLLFIFPAFKSRDLSSVHVIGLLQQLVT